MEKDPVKITFPDRTATEMKNSFYSSSMEGLGNLQLQDIEKQRDKELEKEKMIKQFAEDFGFALRDIRAALDHMQLVPMRRMDAERMAAGATPERNVMDLRTPESRARAMDALRERQGEIRYLSRARSQRIRFSDDEGLNFATPDRGSYAAGAAGISSVPRYYGH